MVVKQASSVNGTANNLLNNIYSMQALKINVMCQRVVLFGRSHKARCTIEVVPVANEFTVQRTVNWFASAVSHSAKVQSLTL